PSADAANAEPGPSAAVIQSVAQEQALPLLQYEKGRLSFMRDYTPPHRVGMFRAALASVQAPLSTDARWTLARAWELAGPEPLATRVARSLYRRLSADDTHGVD